MEPYVSVVVPTFNRCASLIRMLEALVDQTYPADQFEVVVVDDGSTDGTAERLDALVAPYRLTVLRQPNMGPAVARNLGVERARGSLIVFLDDDVVALPHLLAEHVATQGDEQNQVVTGPLSPPGDWPRPSWIHWEEAQLQQQYHAMLTGKYPCTPRQFFSGNASLRRARFLEAGGFDPTFKRAEDLELAFRLRARGASFVFNPRADVLHYASRTFQSWCRIPYQYGRYEVAMQRDKGHPTFRNATREFHYRNRVNRLMARVCVGRPALVRATTYGVRALVYAAERVRARRLAVFALSGLFNVLYWQGVSDELGGPEQVWRSVAASAPLAAAS
jgi:glycosyltransferase involved in cell wall biosynthesis